MQRFQDLIAVVTGAGSGIGAATAKRLATEGAQVVLVGRTEAKLASVAEEIGPQAHVFAADVTRETDVKGLAAYVENTFDGLDVLINNAGGAPKGSIRQMTLAEWDQVQEVNLRSVFLVSQVLGEVMIKSAEQEDSPSKRRAIVNVASLSGYKPGVKIPHYSAAKAAVINLTRTFATELAPYGIRVNSVSPGFVETPLTAQGLQNDKFVQAIKRHTALRRVGKPEEIANVIAFAASSEASYMTGSDLLVDGGWLVS
ncbi:short-chain dehydrogenase/reductase SDR [Caldalkalibacillus thermarum TA2.A1]|uniref:SDR family oxidoreductase n=1 Tax=Caldalkalibacillus thermarum (strain TA2.A1) TaxID=986075 RepID=F5L6J3_CALTT|nr:SDR family oxidoreductase [Caldalkalibacillus thermarum]EGL83054.1 short-chain dehydrogenase/reductase SDR [Caldalkalibacillus thermarum TA2.A1]QZT33554.1 SDR family oxidoreductase [Caldalkalibacillus thermarum TA2.A1]